MKKNKQYSLYSVERIHTLRGLIDKNESVAHGRTAVVYLGEDGRTKRVSYGELAADVREIGTFLIHQGFQQTNIAIVAENSYEWLIWFFAITNSGNVAVAIDREMTDCEIKELILETDITMIISSNAQYTRLEALINGVDCVLVSTFDTDRIRHLGRELITVGNDSYHVLDLKATSLCCIFYTSGTTGKRKGVVLSHENIAYNIVGSCSLFKPSGGTLAVLPFHHAFGLIVGVLMFFHYKESVFIGRGIRYFRKDIILAKPQTMMLVPLFVETIYKQVWNSARKSGKHNKLASAIWISDQLMKVGIDIRRKLFQDVLNQLGGEIEYIISGGAPLDKKYVKAFRSWGIEILNGFGTTECSPVVSVNRNHNYKDGTVGIPLPGSQISISKDGEVMVYGPHVMQGYYGDEIATSEVLEQGWYKTGDIGFIDEDGFLTLTGRKKNLIILSNGENISPEMLEQRVLMIQGVDEAIVYERGNMLNVEIYSKDANESMKRVIQSEIDQMNRTQPAYMKIAKTIFREVAFEKTTTGKIKR